MLQASQIGKKPYYTDISPDPDYVSGDGCHAVQQAENL
jgi:hypothetical protein